MQARQQHPPERVQSPLSASWAYTDLRLLDPVDSSQPELDLLAAYIRRVGQEVQVRLDLMEMAASPSFDLYIALDTAPGGGGSLPIHAEAAIAWDTLLVIPAGRPILALAPGLPSNSDSTRAGLALRVLRNPIQDTVEISMRRSGLADEAYGEPDFGFNVQVFLTPPGSPEMADALGPLRSDGPPPQPAPVLLAFWDTLPAYSPAQALRRWDGAHTGPLGGRHGLYNLLRTARAAQTPLILLDLKTPASLSALDFLGGMTLVQSMVEEGLLILPQALPGASLPASQPGWVLERGLAEGRQQARLFNLPAGPFLFSSSGSEVADRRTRVMFVLEEAGEALTPVRLGRWQGRSLVPIPYTSPPAQAPIQATSDGPTLDVKRALIQTALSASPDGSLGSSPILALGGALPGSTWGEPRSARFTLRYFAAHPWVRLLSASGLPAARPVIAASPSAPGHPATPESLIASSRTPISQAAWQAYLALNTPVYPAWPELHALSGAYLGQVASIQAAADWAACLGGSCTAPPVSNCSADPDGDGQPECILASDSLYALFELDGGSLAYVFSRGANGFHQIIAPTSQLIIGQSDPSTWDLSRGLVADPAVIPGAFYGPTGRYIPKLEEGQLTLAAPDGSLDKVFRLTSQGLRIDYRYTQGMVSSQPVLIPLALDPWLRFSPGWSSRYSGEQTARGWVWQVQDGVRVEVWSSNSLALYTFIDSRRFLGAPEDPNRDYPPGHALPFPLAMLEAAPSTDFYVQIDISP